MEASASSLWTTLQNHYDSEIKPLHLRDLLKDDSRNAALKVEFNDILLDYSHVKMNQTTLKHLEELVEKSGLFKQIEAMFNGEKINTSENRSVLHVALRAQPGETYLVDGKNVVEDVHKVLNNIKAFSAKIRDGSLRGYTGLPLVNVVVIGIGGSYLSIEFVYEAIRSHPDAQKLSQNRKLKFLANVDPIDFTRAVEGLNPEETLFIINSKTFTTAETMLNAKTCRKWILDHYAAKGVDALKEAGKIVNSHFCACSTNLPETSKFGISDEERVFAFWDWVGGRFSVSSCIGILALSFHFGYDYMRGFLDGMHSIDQNFLKTRKVHENIALLLGLVGFYNTSIQKFSARAILPYCQALCKFAPHVQQLDMESNGKRVTKEGVILDYETAVLNFGEPGTNGQHSFYQLLHQGRSTPCEFIGFIKSQQPVLVPGEAVSNHDELMSNFFSQPDALACGKTVSELQSEGVSPSLYNHRMFPGDRSSISILFNQLTPYTTGQLLALYEHRTTVEGFLWRVNSYDQWGVELGKALAKNVRKVMQEGKGEEGLNSATRTLLKRYLERR